MSTSYPHRVAIALGSNLGDRLAHIQHAIESLRTHPRCQLIASSPIIETAPVGPIVQGPYLNAAIVLHMDLQPLAVLGVLLTIERQRGRDRSAEQRWGPRTLDLDLILFDQQQIDEPELCVPHPRLSERRFVLEPLAAIAPDWRVPPHNSTIAQLLAGLPADPPTQPHLP